MGAEKDLLEREAEARASHKRFSREAIEELRIVRSVKYLYMSNAAFEKCVDEAIEKIDRRFCCEQRRPVRQKEGKHP